VKGRLLIFLTVVLMVVLLVALNAASYVRVEQEGDTELLPDRSTLNEGGTGTLALFEYLRQRGVDVVRWRQPMSALTDEGEARPSSLVIVGTPRHEIERREADAVLRWVERGGRLVLIDRSPNRRLLPTPTAPGGWRINSELVEYPGPEVRTDDVEAMTRGVPLVAPAQPTALTRDVAEVARSRFAGRLHVYSVEQMATPYRPPTGVGGGIGTTPPPAATPEEDGGFWGGEEAEQPPPPAPAATPPGRAGGQAEEAGAPVVHVLDGRGGEGALLVDYAYGRGRVVVLSDPYIVSNGGINRADNLFLAVGVVTGGSGGGRVAFDEFHQGYGATENRFFAYFRGTPVLWLFAQAALVVLAVVWTRGRRFARAVPAPRADRRSKLEFVASMAELQQRARAYDLAVENIYQRTRRALARYGGVGAGAPLEQIAARVAARSGRDRRKLEALLRECEDAAAGAPLTARRAVELARRLRELERDLGILMRAREIRQAR
jgi:hypothetical protein